MRALRKYHAPSPTTDLGELRMRLKLKYLLLALPIIFGMALSYRATPAQAAALVIKDATHENSTFSSGNQPTPIYAEPEMTKPTGQALDTHIEAWKITRVAVKGDTAIAYDLGYNQWVATKDGRYNIAGSWYFLEAFTPNAGTPIYSDSLGIHQIGTLDPTIKDWQITQVAQLAGTDIIMAVDLGHNQWALMQTNQYTYLIPKVFYFRAGTPTFDRDGHITSQVATTAAYQVFGATMAAKYGLSLKLGSETQWVESTSGWPYPFPEMDMP